jgi:hypothetical protein
MMDTEKALEAFDLCSELIGLNVREDCDIKISLKKLLAKTWMRCIFLVV